MRVEPAPGRADTGPVWGKRSASALVFAALLAAAAAFGWAGGSYTGVGDVWAFAHAGSTLLSAGWVHAFHVPAVQAGPLELVLASVAKTIGGGHTGFAVVLDLVCTAVMGAAAWSLLGRRPVDFALFAAGACGLSLPRQGYRGHPAELLIAALWLLAAREARRGRVVRAGAMVGVSACFEVWGILGVTVLALAPDLRSVARGAVCAVAVPVACFLPFVAGGDFRMFEFRWPILQGPALLLVGPGRFFSWWMRVAEAAIVVLAGGAVARALRRAPESVWIVPAVIVLVRIALDPMTYGYYYDPALVALLIGTTQLVLHRKELARRLAASFPSLAGRTPSVAD